MSRSSDLFRLQEMDLKLELHRARIEEIQQILAGSKQLKTASIADAKAAELLNKARAANLKAEHLVESQRAKLATTEERLYGGSVINPKELQDLQQESISLKKHLATLEDRLLEAMVDFESAEGRALNAAVKLEEVEHAVAVENQKLTEEERALEAATADLVEDRRVMAEHILEEDLRLYQLLQEKMGTRIVVMLQEDACSACGMQPARSALQDAKNGNTISRCLQCGRILFAG
ncbi:MAG: hypothetical protein JXA97_05655 [Anaerolineales bacterium]|nr:hypothetical protein [Anaerolineales bacterium]